MTHTYTRLAAFTLSLTLPLQAIAAGLHVENSIAGLGLDVHLDDAPVSQQLNIVVADPAGARSRVPVTTDAAGTASAVIAGTKTQKAGMYRVSVENGTHTVATPVDVLVEPESMDPWTSNLEIWTPRIQADGSDEAEIQVTLRDKYGNVLTGRPVSVVSSRPEDYVEARTPETDKNGIQHFILTTDLPGTIQLRAVDLLSGNTIVASAEVSAGGAVGGNSYDTASATNGFYYPRPTATTSTQQGRFYYGQVASFDVVDHFDVEVPAQMRAGEEAQKFTVRAVDRNGNTVEDYMGTVAFSSTDPQATFPATYTFKDRDLGEKSFPLALTFRTGGTHTFRVEDQTNPNIIGEASVTIGGGTTGGTNTIEITSHKDGDYVNALDVVIEGRAPRYANLVVMGGSQDYTGSSDANGAFAIPITLRADQRDFTIRVQDDLARNDSGPVHLILDTDTPEIGDIQFAPENPQEGEKVLVVVESEPKLAQVTLRLPNAGSNTVSDITLMENPTQSGSYQAFFTAPSADMYQAAITVMDRAGNIQEVRTQLTVGAQTLPQVMNVRAEPRVDSVELRWDAISGDVSGYRIYIGDEPDNFLYTLDTGRAITKATVKGLTPGETYVFAVTALLNTMESEEKSEPVTSRVLGFNLEVTPEDGALHVQWTALTTDLPLSSFLLEYGVEQNSLTESRMLNGELRDITIRDLLNGVPYYVRITPITVTGDKLDELAASGNGTPSGEGFKPAPRDDVPYSTTPSGLHGGAPHETPSSGIPPIAWMIAAVLGCIGVYYRWHHRRNIAKTAAFLQAVQSQYKR